VSSEHEEHFTAIRAAIDRRTEADREWRAATDALAYAAAAAYADGVPVAAISRTAGMARQAIYNLLEHHKVLEAGPPRRPPAGRRGRRSPGPR